MGKLLIIKGANFNDVKIDTVTPLIDGPIINISSEGVVSLFAPNAKEYHYTIDGTNPTTSSTLYTTPFTVQDNTTVKAIVVTNNNVVSAVTEKYYTLGYWIFGMYPILSQGVTGLLPLTNSLGTDIDYTFSSGYSGASFSEKTITKMYIKLKDNPSEPYPLALPGDVLFGYCNDDLSGIQILLHESGVISELIHILSTPVTIPQGKNFYFRIESGESYEAYSKWMFGCLDKNADNYNQWVQEYVTAGCIGRGINWKYSTYIGSTTSPISLDFFVK